MKTFVASGFALIGLASAALSADLPVRQASPLPALASAPHNWSGLYVGAHGGYMWSSADTRLTGLLPGGLFALDVAYGTLADRVSVSPDGGLVGGQVGYNLQFGRYVVGLEADASWTNAKGSTTYTGIDRVLFPGVPTRSTFSSEVEGLGTLRVRAGLALDRTLIFATGGLAVGGVKNTLHVKIDGIYDRSWSRSDTEWGWVVGAGIEHALTSNLSAKLEYLHYDLGERTTRYTDAANFGAEHLDYRSKNSGDILRAGLNVKF
jgi:outer membrane immunogenic protein